MPNLMVTNKCNLSCNYCFGVEQMYPRVPKEFMTREVYTSLLDWLERSGLNFFHIMGGEPTQHPDFLWLLRYAAERSFTVDIFSNGITEFSPEQMATARQYSHMWIVNVNNPKNYAPVMREKLERLMEVLAEKVVMTFNIMSTDYDPGYLFEYINKYHLERTVKIGIALPTLHHSNVHARPEEFRDLSRSVVGLSALFKKEGVKAEFECGVPYCFFTEQDKKALERNNFNYHSNCCSILDILPDGNVIYCLPLAKMLRLNFRDFPTYDALRSHMHEYYRSYRSVGYKKSCLTCAWKAECNGSCLARIIPAFTNDAVPGTVVCP